MLNHKSVHHSIPTLPGELGTPWQLSKQISYLSFQLSVHVYSLLGQTEEERKVFFAGVGGGVGTRRGAAL